MREGCLSVSHDNAFSPVFLPLCRRAAGLLSQGADDSGTLTALVKATLARVFSLAVAAGHGPSTTVGREKATNPFFTSPGINL